MGNSVEKRTIAQFVHDAVEMETAIYTLDVMEKKLIGEKNVDLSKAERNLKLASESMNSSRTELNNAKAELDKVKSKKFYETDFQWGRFILFCFVFAIGCLPIMAVIGIVQVVLDNNISPVIACALWWGIAIVGSFIFVKWTTKKDDEVAYNKYKDTINEAENKYNSCLKEYERNKSWVSNTQLMYDNACTKRSMIDEQILSMRSTKDKINSNLSGIYNYGIIPPDYCYMDCVIILDQIFRNDLADTMREAIKIYEERVFRGSVIRGMDKICSMLGQLSSDMSAISLKLDMINNNVAHMSSDLDRFNRRIADEGAKNRAVTEELIKETQLGRYTNEKLLESNKRLEYYAEEYRMGRMPIR